MADYKQNSPYFTTPKYGNYLGMMANRPIPKLVDDQSFTISETYNLRPDLLAFDLYGDPALWWVFAQRNPNTLVNPLHDFTTGTNIYLPQKSTLESALGV
jgi:hypothetical protein